MTLEEVRKLLRGLGDAQAAKHAQSFFKTGKGEYGEGDRFLGIRVPVLRKQIRLCAHLRLNEILSLLHSSYHEERLFALLLLVDRFSKAGEPRRGSIYRHYLASTRYINNWDLVDSSASQIVGAYLEDKDRQVLYELADSANLWERRIAIISTFHFIRLHDFSDTLDIASLLQNDQQDLIHKAVGWMLREVGKRDAPVEEEFLKSHYREMPRTMLRYAIERFPEQQRKKYLQGRI
jgi:3-methyladenine DNA glycosylase AlkD